MNDKILELNAMLASRRPHGSKGEEAFLDTFIRPLQTNEYVTDTFTDAFGNLFFEVAGGSSTLFCAHSDTVHRDDERQVVVYDENLMLAYKDDGHPLGADDGAGLWLLMEIIRAGIPCWVAVFRAEEKGGQGSKFAAGNMPEFFKKFDRAVAFDRRGTTDVITHQAIGRCCSNEFADELSAALNDKLGMKFSRCSGGIYTDTAELTHLISECTNISVGYDREHSKDETLDVEHLTLLREAIMLVDWESLPAVRDPSKIERFGFGMGWDDDFELDMRYPTSFGTKKRRAPVGVLYLDDILGMGYTDLLAWIESSRPDDIAETLLGVCDVVGDYEANFGELPFSGDDQDDDYDLRFPASRGISN